VEIDIIQNQLDKNRKKVEKWEEEFGDLALVNLTEKWNQ
jgi:hypothetical protein